MAEEIKFRYIPKLLIADDAHWDAASDELEAKVAEEIAARLTAQMRVAEHLICGMPELDLAEVARIVSGGCEHRWLPSDLAPGRSFFCSKCREWKVLPKKGMNPYAR